MIISIASRQLLRNTFTRAIVRQNTTFGKAKLDVNQIKHKTKVPLKPFISISDIKTEKVSIDKDTIELLMRLSLVNLTDQ